MIEKGRIVARGPMSELITDEVVREHLTFSNEGSSEGEP